MLRLVPRGACGILHEDSSRFSGSAFHSGEGPCENERDYSNSAELSIAVGAIVVLERCSYQDCDYADHNANEQPYE